MNPEPVKPGPSATASEGSRQGPRRRTRRVQYLALLVLPALTVAAWLWLKQARGPYWLGSYSDHAYCYLFNGLRLAQFRPPGMYVHPGTPAMAVCTAAIGLRRLLADSGPLVSAVLSSPESYLQTASAFFLAIYVLVLLGAGGLVLRRTGSLPAALLVQATPFFSPASLEGLAHVGAEPLLLSLTTAFGLLLWAGCRPLAPRGELKLAAASGGLAGVLIAAKYTAIAPAIAPLFILRRWRARLLCVVVAGAAFLLSVTPLLPEARSLFRWAFRLAINTGPYGQGAPRVVEVRKYLECLGFSLGLDAAFTAALVLNLAGLALLARRAREGRDARFRCLLGLAVCYLFQWLLVAKNPRSSYLVPSLGLLGFNAALWYRVADASGAPRRRLAVVGIVLILLGVQGFQTVRLRSLLDRRRAEHLAVYALAREKSRNWRIVAYHGTSSLPYALWLGNVSVRLRYASELDALYPDAAIYSVWNRGYVGLLNQTSLQALAKGVRGVLFQGSPFDGYDFEGTPLAVSRMKRVPDGIVLVPLAGGKVEMLYRLKEILPDPAAPGRIDPRPTYEARP